MFPVLLAYVVFFLFLFFLLVLWVGSDVEVDVDRITIFPLPSLFFSLPTILSLTQVTVI